MNASVKKKGSASLAWFPIVYVNCSFLLYVLGKVTDGSISEMCQKNLSLQEEIFCQILWTVHGNLSA